MTILGDGEDKWRIYLPARITPREAARAYRVPLHLVLRRPRPVGVRSAARPWRPR